MRGEVEQLHHTEGILPDWVPSVSDVSAAYLVLTLMSSVLEQA
jgi:hypothetical protein